MAQRTRRVLAVRLIVCAGLLTAACGQGAVAPPPAAPAGGSPAADAAPAPGSRPPLARAHEPIAGVAPHGDMTAHPGGAPGGTDLAWSVPQGWVEVTPSSAMRRAQYRIPAAGGGEEGECVVFYFGPGQGGDAAGNVERWASQFEGPGGMPPRPTVSEIKVGDRSVTRVELRGTYSPSPMSMTPGPPPSPKPGYALLGAVVPGPDANWFFRCTGPEPTMRAHRERFDQMIASIK